MFKSGSRDREDSPGAPPTAAKKGMFSVLGVDVVVTGNIVATADLHIDGRIEGDVGCASLVQGGDSVIVGSVIAETARIAGTIEGSVRVRQLQVERTARITGDVEYDAITIETGARVDGTLRHLAKGSGPAPAGTVTKIGRSTGPDTGDEPQQKLLG